MRKFTVLEGLDLRKDIEKRDLYKGVFNMVQVDLQIEMNQCKERPSYMQRPKLLFICTDVNIAAKIFVLPHCLEIIFYRCYHRHQLCFDWSTSSRLYLSLYSAISGVQTTVEETSNQFIHRGLACGNMKAMKKTKLMAYTDKIITPEVIPSATGYAHSAASSMIRGTVPQNRTTCEMPEA